MSSTTAVSNSKIVPTASTVQLVNGDRALSSTITTTAKSSVTTVTASAKKTRKSEGNFSDGSTSFLPIAPHQTFYSPNQGLTLASVQQQQLQAGVALFSSPTMMALGAGPQGSVQQPGTPQAGQQLVMAAPGQAMGPTFNHANGQGLIQTSPGMGMLSGIPPVQVIQTAGGGQQTYFQHVYNPGLQPMILAGPNLMAYQNHTPGLAIQIPGTGTGPGTMITTNQLAATTPTTPVKNQSQNQQIIKSVTISPQQPQATKSSANATQGGVRGQAQANQQIIQQTFQPGTPNQAFVIGFPGTTTNQAGATILPSTPANNRKNTVSSANLIQKIQPANNTLTTSPIIAPAQFKSNTSPFQQTQNATSPANGQTIMVHGQGLQQGPGGIQLAPNQTIISSFPTLQSGLGGLQWATGPSINQQATQLVTPNGQPIFLRQANDQTHMFIQTSNNQFQAVPMQMTQGTQQQTSAPGTMQVTQTGQPLVTTSINQSLPIIQTNTVMTPTTIVTQQPNITPGTNNLLTSAATSQTNTSVSTPVSNTSRQRPLRPASTQLTTSTQTSAKQKLSMEANRASVGNVPKLAPKTGLVTSTGMQANTLPRTSFGAQTIANLPFTTKPNESHQASKSLPQSTNPTLVISTANSKAIPPKVSSTSAATQSTSTTMATSLNSTTSTVVSTVSTNTITTLVGNANIVQPNKGSSPVPVGPKMNRKIEKKDSSNGMDLKMSMPTSVQTKTPKGIVINPMRNSSSGLIKNNSTNVNLTNNLPGTQMINGVVCQMPTNPQMKSTVTNGINKAHLSNGNVSKSIATTNVPKSTPAPKNKPKLTEVLTHVIDGYVIQESPSPFPINGYANSNDADHQPEKNGQVNTDLSIKSDTKENAQANKPSELFNGQNQKESLNVNGISKNIVNSELAKPKMNNGGFVEAGNVKNKKNKVKKITKIATPNNAPQVVPQLSLKPPGLALPNQNPIISLPVQTLSFVNLPTGQGMTTSLPQISAVNGTNVGAKRPPSVTAKDSPTAYVVVPEKRTRVNSPVTVKPDLQANQKPQNGVPESIDSSVKEPKAEPVVNNAPEGEGLWLPPGGKELIKWNVQDVYDFIHHITGCAEFAEDFRNQEIDGQALMLIKEDHIIAILHMKLGPALKICRKIKDLKSMFEM